MEIFKVEPPYRERGRVLKIYIKRMIRRKLISDESLSKFRLDNIHNELLDMIIELEERLEENGR